MAEYFRRRYVSPISLVLPLGRLSVYRFASQNWLLLLSDYSAIYSQGPSPLITGGDHKYDGWYSNIVDTGFGIFIHNLGNDVWPIGNYDGSRLYRIQTTVLGLFY